MEKKDQEHLMGEAALQWIDEHACDPVFLQAFLTEMNKRRTAYEKELGETVAFTYGIEEKTDHKFQGGEFHNGGYARVLFGKLSDHTNEEFHREWHSFFIFDNDNFITERREVALPH